MDSQKTEVASLTDVFYMLLAAMQLETDDGLS